ncbi:hypothetical protein BDBG_09513 [Blastomyces gilchristii SLH14081]|uniref:Uncharacterized protein n=1 Tax=Blastomyces gilchristii (strain SLH14081) TaxID=559298 RepID=A0A179V581_BLAGS|nr:uncharacterized protein BDBG_09513 [Blastomyces gilchristii SLH14081]OAT14501.1 hypothetical protein BDBG_09513 [Blastomyces gilchristii SLH14081]
MNLKIQELLAELERERAELDQERQWCQDAEAEVRSKRRQHEEEQQQHEEAEALAASSESSTLPLFLHACHELLTNQRVPSHIMLWDTFTEEQMKVWHKLNQHSHFLTEKLFSSLHQLNYIRQLISSISSEWDLQYYEQEMAVDLNPGDQQLSVELMVGTESSTRKRMVLAIKYKAPHRLTQDEIMGGLAQDFHPSKEVIGKDSDDPDFCLKRESGTAMFAPEKPLSFYAFFTLMLRGLWDVAGCGSQRGKSTITIGK